MEGLIRRVRQDHTNDLIHLSDREITKIRPVGNQRIHWKPHNCLFFSYGTQWIDWCFANNFNSETYRFVYRAKIDMSHFVILESYADVRKFTTKYGVDIPEGFSWCIYWNRVKNDYSGFAIKNYRDIFFEYMNTKRDFLFDPDMWIYNMGYRYYRCFRSISC